MPKVTRKDKPEPKRRRKPPVTAPVYEAGGEEVRVSSVIFGLLVIAALMVAGAAWMGGSLSQIERRTGSTIDGMARSVGLAVEYVFVEGVAPDIAEQVRAAALVEPGENMFRADPHIIRERIEETRLVANVRVHRFWPNHVLILADPAEAVARYNQDGDLRLVDSLGRVVSDPYGNAGQGLLELRGEGAGEAVNFLLASLASVPELEGQISSAHRIGERRWDLHTITGVKLRLPADERLPRALERLAALEQQAAVLSGGVSQIDLRAPNRVFVVPSGGEQVNLIQMAEVT